MMTNAWCRDVQRDEAVRAAEDNRQGPLPTLEEAIAAPFAKTAKIRESETAVDLVIPAADAHGGGVVGLRTERVTLEVKHACKYPAAEWVPGIVQEACSDPGECVRVVEEVDGGIDEAIAHGATLNALAEAWESLAAANRGITRLTDEREAARRERDAAIREREEAKARVDYLERDRKVWALQSGSFEKEANALRARVADLESQLESVACRAATAENRVAELERELEAERAEADRVVAAATAKLRAVEEKLESAPAASGAANSSESPVSSEPVAWGVRWANGDYAFPNTKKAAELHTKTGGTVVPLYTSPPPARGWLMAEERGLIESLVSEFQQNADDLCFFKNYVPAENWQRKVNLLRSILARSTPPEVVLPGLKVDTRDPWTAAGYNAAVEECGKALAAAGVPVKQSN